VGGESLGNRLAAAIGAFYGPLAVIPGIFAGLIILAIIG
jgi:hypothetical protein